MASTHWTGWLGYRNWLTFKVNQLQINPSICKFKENFNFRRTPWRAALAFRQWRAGFNAGGPHKCIGKIKNWFQTKYFVTMNSIYFLQIIIRNKCNESTVSYSCSKVSVIHIRFQQFNFNCWKPFFK